ASGPAQSRGADPTSHIPRTIPRIEKAQLHHRPLQTLPRLVREMDDKPITPPATSATKRHSWYNAYHRRNGLHRPPLNPIADHARSRSYSWCGTVRNRAWPPTGLLWLLIRCAKIPTGMASP